MAPKLLVIAERFRFHKRDQKDGERVSTYLAELRKLAEHCQFGDYLNDALRDRFACGLRAGSIQKRLLAEDKLTLKKATEMAIAMETAAKDAIELQQQTHPSTMVHTVVKRKQSCYRCGRNGHTADSCRFKEATCHSCGKPGHIAPACRSKPRSPKKPNQKKPQPKHKGKVKAVDTQIQDTDSDEDVLIARIDIHNVGHSQCDMSTAIWVTLQVNNRPVKMEVDTGSAITILSMANYKKLLPNEQLQPTNTRLQTYTGEKIVPEGLLNVKVQYKNQQHTGKIYIIKGTSTPLLGRDWLSHIKLDWPNLFAMTTAPSPKGGSTEEKLKMMLEEYPELFVEEIGKLKGIKGKLNLHNKAQPVFQKARQVPYALRPKVEAELTKLESQGIISPVKTSD